MLRNRLNVRTLTPPPTRLLSLCSSLFLTFHANSTNYIVFIQMKFSTFVIQKRALLVFYAIQSSTHTHTHHTHARCISIKTRVPTIEKRTSQCRYKIFVLIIDTRGIKCIEFFVYFFFYFICKNLCVSECMRATWIHFYTSKYPFTLHFKTTKNHLGSITLTTFIHTYTRIRNIINGKTKWK